MIRSISPAASPWSPAPHRGSAGALPRVLAGHGAAVGLAARQVDRLEDLREEIEKRGGRAAGVALDVTDHGAIENALDRVESALGPIDILINNAGVAVSKAVLEQTEADWDKVLDTNLKGAFFTAQAVARRMVAREQKPAWGGTIVNIASVLALTHLRQLGRPSSCESRRFPRVEGGSSSKCSATQSIDFA